MTIFCRTISKCINGPYISDDSLLAPPSGPDDRRRITRQQQIAMHPCRSASINCCEVEG